MRIYNISILIQHNCIWHLLSIILSGCIAVCVEQNRKIIALRFDIGLYFCYCLFGISRNCQKLEPLILVLRINLVELSHLFETRLTPRCPKTYKNRTASGFFIQFNILSIQISKFKIRCFSTLQVFFALCKN